MTVIKIFKKNNQINTIECSGHSGYAENGCDIVCSAISSLTQGCVLGLIEVAGIKDIEIKKNDKNGYYRFSIPYNISEIQRFQANTLLNTLELCLKDLEKGYSKYIKLEVK